MPSKIVVVVGATGGQGGSVISTLLKDNSYQLRGISRNLSSPKALELTSLGVEMVEANLDDEGSLSKAFDGASIIFAVTNFFEPFATLGPQSAMEIETSWGIKMAKAASKIESLEHYIWSTLPNAHAISHGAYKVPHMDAKSMVDDFIKRDSNLLPKTTFLWNTFFISTLMYPMLVPNKLESAGKYVWLQPVSPDTKVVTIGDHTTNTGVFVAAILSQPLLTKGGQYVLASVGTMSMGEMLKKWSDLTGSPSVYVKVTLEEYDKLWPMWGREVGLNLQFSESAGDDSWPLGASIGSQELGITEGLIDVEDSLAHMLKD